MTTITKGNYTATIRKDGDMYFVLVTYENRCVPGVRGKHFANIKTAQSGAKRMLAKI